MIMFSELKYLKNFNSASEEIKSDRKIRVFMINIDFSFVRKREWNICLLVQTMFAFKKLQ